jgi:hypothetical protein
MRIYYTEWNLEISLNVRCRYSIIWAVPIDFVDKIIPIWPAPNPEHWYSRDG